MRLHSLGQDVTVLYPNLIRGDRLQKLDLNRTQEQEFPTPDAL
ncbi:hypothetical protein [Planktothrix sp. FACHB-1365]|nr:hypothetical protein [Planktothrix sp. FACHB-1365]